MQKKGIVYNKFMKCLELNGDVEIGVSLGINPRKIAVDLTSAREIGVEYRSLPLELLEMFSAPHSDRKLLSRGNGQARNVVVPVQLVPKAIGVIMDVFFSL